MNDTSDPTTLRVTAIAAIAQKSRAIGHKGGLLWKIPGDLPRFREITTGQTILMGQKTFDGIGRPLPNRTTIVLTQDPAWQFEGVHVAHDVPEALAIAQTLGSTLIVVGGGMVYRAMLPFTDELLLTLVDDDPEADTFFPEFEGDFQEIDHGEWVNTPDAPPFRFTRWVRTKEITSNT